jgi:hypothetical protein
LRLAVRIDLDTLQIMPSSEPVSQGSNVGFHVWASAAGLGDGAILANCRDG